MPDFFFTALGHKINNMKRDSLYGIECNSEKFHTNNSWGFGGAVGISYKFPTRPDVEVRIGKACYRHMNSTKFIAIYKDGKRVFDEDNTPAQRKKAEAMIKKLLSEPAGDSE